MNTCNNCAFIPHCLTTKQANPKQLYKIKKRRTLCSEQQSFKSLYVIKSGVLKSSFLELEGKERILSFYLPGEILGLEAIQNQSYPFSVEAITDTILCEISYQELLTSLNTTPALQQHLLQASSKRINMGACHSFVRAEQRVASFLLEIAERLNTENLTLEFSLPIPRQTIGDYLCLAPETITRIFKNFEKSGILTTHKKLIKILDLPRLDWLLQGGLLENFSH